MPPRRNASIELQDEMSRNDYKLDLKKNDGIIQHWIKSSRFEITICILSLLAFSFNQILIYTILFRYDDALLSENFARSIVLSMDVIWTIFASLSLTIEIIFFFETALRMIFVDGFSQDIPCVIEGILVIFYLVPRLLLPVRISLIVDLCILLRCWRIKRILDNEISFERDLLYFTTCNLIKEKDQLELLYKKKLDAANSDLKAVNLKLDKLLGVKVVSD